jgi:hypothetical protein
MGWLNLMESMEMDEWLDGWMDAVGVIASNRAE